MRLAFMKLKDALTKESNSDLLRWAVFSVNSTVRPEGIFPSLYVFRTLPRSLCTENSTTNAERIRAIESTIDSVMKDQAKRKLEFARTYRGPYGNERFDIDRLIHGDPVHIHRNKTMLCVQDRDKHLYKSFTVMFYEEEESTYTHGRTEDGSDASIISLRIDQKAVYNALG